MLGRQQQQQRDKIQALQQERLTNLDGDLRVLSKDYESSLLAELRTADRNTTALGQIRRREPAVRSVLLVDRDGRLIYPAKPATNMPSSMVWHAALSELARSRPVGEVAESRTNTKTVQFRDMRWQSWFHDGGLQLVIWLPRSDRTATGIVLERGRWMADLINALPESGQGITELRDGTDQVVYRWGDATDVEVDAPPLASIRLSAPWNAWRLTFTERPSESASWLTDGTVALLASLLAVATAIALLGIYVLTSLRRQMTLASQRVSFASHVSHELRTPLTNIRLYAELAKRDLGRGTANEWNDQAITRLDVIEEESQRLSRLVTGVLDLVSGKGRLRTSEQSPDAIVQRIADSFSPALQSLGIEAHLQLDAPNRVALDKDVVELVLVNLLSNVEKYASSGDRVDIRTRQSDSFVTIDVVDSGPGISKTHAKRVFEPFARLDDSLSAPAGTGLGLAIARNSARRHGGDLVLIPGNRGAHFRLTLRIAGEATSQEVSE